MAQKAGKVSTLGIGLLAGALVLQGLLHRAAIYPTWTKRYSPAASGKGLVGKGMDPMQMLAALAGFRELVAGILWVRADAFFDSGNYDAILPIIRLVTMLDPSEIDVYATGMWHIGYNFTDEEQRSDRRYIPSALALGREGTIHNPDTYELFFETGWIWYHKIDDNYEHAVDWFVQARERKDMIPARKNLLGMAYQRDGKIEEALKTYEGLYNEALQKFKTDATEFSARQNRDSIESNIDNTLVRMVQRGYVAEKEHRPLNGYDVYPPFDVGFSVKATVVEPRVIRFEGTWNVLPVGTRIRVTLRDEKYTMPVGENGAEVDVTQPAGLKWDYSNDVNLDPPRDRTFMQDQLFVRNRRFNRKVDMSKDITMYPFTGDKYVLEFFYDPRSAPPHIQDKFSWNGEGMTDKNFLNKDVRPGQNCVYAKLILTRDQILQRGEWSGRSAVVKTPNYEEVSKAQGKDDVIVDIPALRGGK